MSVLLETSLGDLVIDLETDSCPNTCKNFLKLCKAYYYNLNAFFNGKQYPSVTPRIVADRITKSRRIFWPKQAIQRPQEQEASQYGHS